MLGIILGTGAIVGNALGGGNGNPLQYSRLENPMEAGAWRATVHRVTEHAGNVLEPQFSKKSPGQQQQHRGASSHAPLGPHAKVPESDTPGMGGSKTVSS